MFEQDLRNIFTYHQPTEQSSKSIQELREFAFEFALRINSSMVDCADKSAAIRLLRECVMTANAGIVLNQVTVVEPHDIKLKNHNNPNQ